MKKLKNLSKNLKKIRNNAGLSMSDFAKRLDLPLSTLWDVENRNNSSLPTLILISEKLGMSIDVLLSDDMQVEEQNLILKIWNNTDVLSGYTNEQQTEICKCLQRIVEIMNKRECDINDRVKGTMVEHSGGVENTKEPVCV